MIETIISDVGFVLALRWTIALVFLIGGIHKLRAPAAFTATLSAYQLLPKALLSSVAYLLIVAEVFTAISLLLNTRIGSMLALVLLVLYTIAISINLARGRRDIDCGCAGPAVRQTLSAWLVVRNVIFILMALLSIANVSTPRGLEALDWFTAALTATTVALIVATATQLSSTTTRFTK